MSSLFLPAQSFGTFMKYHMLNACVFCAEPNQRQTLSANRMFLPDIPSLQRQIHQAYQLLCCSPSLPHSSLQ